MGKWVLARTVIGCNCTQRLLYQRNMGSSRGISRNGRSSRLMSRERDGGERAREKSKPGASAKPSGAQKTRFKPKAAAPGEVRVPVVRTDCDEIGSIAEIVLRSKADIFPVERHTQKNSKRRCRASRPRPTSSG